MTKFFKNFIQILLKDIKIIKKIYKRVHFSKFASLRPVNLLKMHSFLNPIYFSSGMYWQWNIS